ncbi:MAG: aminoacyl-tRNA hydrolase [Fimbriimonadaceae bacterium]|nr:aminoacyl-tRNA hydrolase [Fimbriimonadaceae bacterium]
MAGLLGRLWPAGAAGGRQVIVGLGNPGAEYQQTRHNIGFMVVDALLAAWPPSHSRNKFDADLFEIRRETGDPLLLVKPRTFMNLSGKTVSALLRWYDLPLDALMVVCDDFHLPLGRLRFRRNGSAGGQNGLSDIIAKLGTNEFARLRIGIAAPTGDAIGHVLGKFAPAEKDTVNQAIARSREALGVWVSQGIDEVMNRYNAG